MRIGRQARGALLLLAVWGCLSGRFAPGVTETVTGLPPAADVKVDFVDDIQPLLTEKCIECHGTNMAAAGLRLHERESAMRGGDSGAVILPGDSAASSLIWMVSGTEDGKRMPLTGEPITLDQIGLLRAWIDQGAPWGGAEDGVGTDATELAESGPYEHWAFNPIHPTKPPAVENEAWIRNPIDRFVLAELEAKGIEPSPEADRRTLIRRLSFDLLGLPPTPGEVEGFVQDGQPDAYERLVDRLLASPHFGERWGRHWLDTARYADSDGYEKDSIRPHSWRYRDWVIDAINRDLPFDEFTIQQLAGDLLPATSTETLVATGFHRNTLTNREGGVDPEEFRVAAIVDRTNTTGSAWLGLTVGCAQCHSHKYDPITQHEYYGLYAFFNNADEEDIKAPTEDETEKYVAAKENFDHARDALLTAVDAYEGNALADVQRRWEMGLSAPDVVWKDMEPVRASSSGGASLSRSPDGSLLAAGKKADRETFELVMETGLRDITGFRLEVIAHPSLSGEDPRQTPDADFKIAELAVRANEPDNDDSVPVVLQDAYGGYGMKIERAPQTIDGDSKTSWRIPTQYGLGYYVLVVETKEEVGFEKGTRLTFTLDQEYGIHETVAQIRLSATRSPRPIRTEGLVTDVAGIIQTRPERRNAEQKQRLQTFYASIDPVLAGLKGSLSVHDKAEPSPPNTQAMVMAEREDDRRESHVHVRGDFMRKGDEVVPITPSILHEFAPRNGRSDRLDLARWLMDARNPLTPRVAANRVWSGLFGVGLVETSEDFGTRGEEPAYPDLLDWLGRQYIAQDWSRKALIKTIVTSSTYRQVSRNRDDLKDIDPKNKFLARQNRYRVEAEIIRDIYLAASGLLYPKIGGPSVRPRLPADVAALGYAGSIRWAESKGADAYRRGLYILFQRTVPYPMLMTFDCPDSNTAIIRRRRSNTPLQALTLLNDPVFVECAQALGNRILEEKDATGRDERLDYAYQLCVARPPSEPERERLVELLDDFTLWGEENPDDALDLVGNAPPKNIAVSQAAAWTGLARTVLNLDEVITRE